MFFAEHAAELRAVDGRRLPQPPLVFKAAGKELWVRALASHERPVAHTRLKTAPYWNCSDDGHLCQDSMRSPEVGTSLDAIAIWEKAFFQSRFTHAYGPARLTTHPGGFVGLWTELVGAGGAFPTERLTDARETLQEFVERRG